MCWTMEPSLALPILPEALGLGWAQTHSYLLRIWTVFLYHLQLPPAELFWDACADNQKRLQRSVVALYVMMLSSRETKQKQQPERSYKHVRSRAPHRDVFNSHGRPHPIQPISYQIHSICLLKAVIYAADREEAASEVCGYKGLRIARVLGILFDVDEASSQGEGPRNHMMAHECAPSSCDL